ncbi:hypothetical protein COCC4DRAFT_131785 [Bipolaris maydis ATCC 48331]|uniref:Uncharacterized protein n=2 Tax=Cochliobolus heterostrophus TaxID=5016 RepID=M2V2M6_COCH5|nr:uncharacterized protein COCC4DRAFT_131785 [Bipolaris maydis ATCC 48331]EMD94227.1 hypothetical protein COCHEDRAFT_1028153 [Bipolaris maydis C5]ENI07475.1 hypothetical protein COCC4DRAFT_131785 [Bipolaris maydis ATCC 48331]KAH7563970.1 hypothetical protein BM1_01017 [Bipolaris maydis]
MAWRTCTWGTSDALARVGDSLTPAARAELWAKGPGQRPEGQRAVVIMAPYSGTLLDTTSPSTPSFAASRWRACQGPATPQQALPQRASSVHSAYSPPAPYRVSALGKEQGTCPA